MERVELLMVVQEPQHHLVRAYVVMDHLAQYLELGHGAGLVMALELVIPMLAVLLV